MNFKKSLSLVMVAAFATPMVAVGAKKVNRTIAEVAQYSEKDLVAAIEEKTKDIERAQEVLEKGERDEQTGMYRISGYMTVATGIGAAGSILATVHNHVKVNKLLKDTITYKGPGKNKQGPPQEITTPGLESRLKGVKDGIEMETTRISELLRGLEGTKDKKGKEISSKAVNAAWNHWFERGKTKGLIQEESRLTKQIEGLKKGRTVRRVVTAGAVTAFLASALVHATAKENDTVELTEEEYAQYVVGLNVMQMELDALKNALAEKQ